MLYSPLLIKPMREELTQIGFTELWTANDVDRAMQEARTGLTPVVINAANAVAAATTRPGVRIALEEASTKPAKLITVFADQDKEATARMRAQFPDIPPSEPSIALLKDGEVVHFVPRHRMDSGSAQQMAAELKSAFTEYSQ